jgi:hypothetical protein
MKITDIEAYLCRFPLPEAFFPSWIPGLPEMNNTLLLVKLLTEGSPRRPRSWASSRVCPSS